MSERQASRRPRAIRRTAAVLLGGLTIAVLAILPSAAAMRAELVEGRRLLNEGRSLLVDGELSEAPGAFRRAGESFRAARSRGDRFPLSSVASLPLLGRTPRVASEVAAAGSEVAAAGEMLAGAVAGIRGGIPALLPQADGSAGGLAALGDPLRDALDSIRRARARVEASPKALLLPGVGDAREALLDQLGRAERVLRSGEELLTALPQLLGAGGQRRYIVAAQNPAELRGTGGIIGAYSILTVENGTFSFTPFRPVQTLPVYPPGVVPSPNRDYSRNYDTFGGAGFWLNINMTPDFPSAARAMLASYREATGERLDGVIAADPFALRGLLTVTGPVEVPDLGTRVSADDVVAFTANEAYARFRDPALRKRVLGSVARRVFERFISSDDDLGQSLDAMRSIAAGGHVLVYSTEPSVQRSLAAAGLAGNLPGPGAADFLSVVQNNAAGNKVDYYLRRTVRHVVQLMPDGSAETLTTVRLRNDAPTSGQPRYVIGPYPGASGPGENVTIATLFADGSARLRSAHLDGSRMRVVPGRELGHRMFQRYVRIRSGEDRTLRYRLRVGRAWRVQEDRRLYRLTILTQPTINPSRTRIEIQVPAGTTIESVGGGLQAGGSVATWQGIPGRRLELWVRFG